MSGILSLLIFLPLIAGGVLCFCGRRLDRWVWPAAAAISLAELAIVLLLWLNFDAAATTLQFVERRAWIPTLGVEYFLGVDGLGLVLVALTSLLVPMSLLLSWQRMERPALYTGFVLFLEAGLMGTFTALNFFHWFIFWELSLVPAFFLIKFWGGPQRSAAAVQFFVYTMVGSIALLLAFLALFQATRTFDLVRLAEMARTGALQTAVGARLSWLGLDARQLSMLLFCGAFLGFAVKVPLVPFHTWLPAAYTEAPTAVTMLLTGALSKMGVYGFLRILLPIFPEPMRAAVNPLLALAVLTIIVSAFSALAQGDLKRMFAYSSINHLGYCLLGIFAVAEATTQDGMFQRERAAALNGVILQMFNHGVTAATLFCFIGFIERRSGGRRGVDEFGGLRRVAPIFCGVMGIFVFASLGLPGLSGFVGEFLIFKGSVALAGWRAGAAALGLLLTAVFLLSMTQRVFHGPLNTRWAVWPELTWRERMVIIPALALVFALGLYPQAIIGKVNATVLQLAGSLTF